MSMGLNRSLTETFAFHETRGAFGIVDGESEIGEPILGIFVSNTYFKHAAVTGTLDELLGLLDESETYVPDVVIQQAEGLEMLAEMGLAN